MMGYGKKLEREEDVRKKGLRFSQARKYIVYRCTWWSERGIQ